MLDHGELLERTLKDRLVAIIRLRHEAPLARVAEALVAGGIRALEFTLTSPGAVPAITTCRARFARWVRGRSCSNWARGARGR